MRQPLPCASHCRGSQAFTTFRLYPLGALQGSGSGVNSLEASADEAGVAWPGRQLPREFTQRSQF